MFTEVLILLSFLFLFLFCFLIFLYLMKHIVIYVSLMLCYVLCLYVLLFKLVSRLCFVNYRLCSIISVNFPCLVTIVHYTSTYFSLICLCKIDIAGILKGVKPYYTCFLEYKLFCKISRDLITGS